jgi:hypothetical protein
MWMSDDGDMGPNGQEPEQPQPPQMKPAMHVQPGPMSSICRRLPDGNVVVHIEHTTGATILPMTQAFAKGLLAQLQEATGGIVVPPSAQN